jgi:hypothetical protein
MEIMVIAKKQGVKFRLIVMCVFVVSVMCGEFLVIVL